MMCTNKIKRKKKGPRSLREAEAEGLCVVLRTRTIALIIALMCCVLCGCCPMLKKDPVLKKDARKKAPGLCARQRPRALCVIVQDRGDRTRVAALVREAASHVEREKGRTAHGIPWWSPTQVLTMPEAA